MNAAWAEAFSALPPQARRLLIGVSTVAAGMAALVIAADPGGVSVLAVLVLAAAIAGGEALWVVLPYRRGGAVRLTISDAALMAGLLMFGPTDVVLGATLGVLAWQAIDRVPAVKLIFNLAQYMTGAAAAALAIQIMAPRPGPVTVQAVAALAVGLVCFLCVNIVAVGGIVAAMSEQPWTASIRRMAPTSVLVTACNACLGVVAVALSGSHPWLLPAMAAPLLLVVVASRQRIRSQVERERSKAFVAVEQRLGEAANHAEVAREIVAGVEAVLGCNGAVWRDRRWVTPVPDGSGLCPVDAELVEPLLARGGVLGPSVDGACAAIGLGGGVLIAWSGDLGLTPDSTAWLARLGRSGRVHFDRANTRVALEQQRATLEAVVDGTADGIFVLDRDEVIRLWNPAMGKLSGLAATAVIGRRASDAVGPGPWASEGVHDVRPAQSHPDDDRVWRVSISPVQERSFGDLRVAVVHDVSAERRLARMKDDMLAVVSHELRTPLTPIKASAQLLHRRWEDIAGPQRLELLAQIEQGADHLTRLVDDLLLVGQLSAAGGARPRVRSVPVDIAALAREDIEQLGRAWPEHDITFVAPASLHGSTDPLRLRQILGNLIDNACKYSPPGSPVQIRLTAESGDALFVVVDRGRGISATDLERVFERFERVEDPLHMTTSGAGLGLYIVRALTRGLGGDIRLDSQLGVGTTVRVRLPLGADAPAEEATPTLSTAVS